LEKTYGQINRTTKINTLKMALLIKYYLLVVPFVLMKVYKKQQGVNEMQGWEDKQLCF
jgi:hypothetical protein